MGVAKAVAVSTTLIGNRFCLGGRFRSLVP